MRKRFRSALLGVVVTVGWFTYSNAIAQTPVILTLKGVAGADGGTDVQAVGNFLYTAWSGDTNHPGGLEIFTITNPAAPLRVGGYESQLPANAIYVTGRYAYLALGAARTFTNDPGAFEIIDLNAPANPVRVGGIDTPGCANTIRVAGNYAYVGESTRWTGSNFLGALEIFDVSTPTNPIRVETFDTAGSVTSIDVSGSFAYLTDGVTDLQVLDVSAPGHTRRAGIYQPDLSRCAFEPSGHANYVQVVGNLAYSSGDDGLNVLDISDPSQPVRVLDNTCIPISRFHVAGHYAFMVIYHSLLNTFYLTIADTTNPTNWVTVGEQANWPPMHMHVVNNWVYLAAGNLLAVYEISDVPSIKSISRSGNSLIVAWTAVPGFRLQGTDSLYDPVWKDVPDTEGQGQIELHMTTSNRFFRLARP